MEMEIDINEIKKIEKDKSEWDRIENLKSSVRSPKRKEKKEKSISPIRRPSPKRRRTRSPKRDVGYLHKSPGRLSPVRRNSLKRSLQKNSPSRKSSLKRSPRTSPARRTREKSYGKRLSTARRSRSHSPYYRSRRGRYSPYHGRRDHSVSPISEREMWMRRRRSRSRSPRRKREEKKSFLQEIAEKLNETRPPVNIMPPLQPLHFVHAQVMSTVPTPVPAPVPPPNHTPFFTSQIPSIQPIEPPTSAPQYDPYDQNFFIGPTSCNFNTPQAQSLSQPQIPLNPLSVQRQVNSPMPINTSSNFTPVKQNITIPNTNDTTSRNLVSSQAHQINKADSKDDITKLFQDKKITLSEFLAITAKPEVSSSSPAHLQEKIKVISRCQDAIKILGSGEKKFAGKFVLRRTVNNKMFQEKNRSPLIRLAQVKIPFTEVPNKNEQRTTFTGYINNLLQSLGIMKEVVVDVDEEVSSNINSSFNTSTSSPPPPPQITPKHNEFLVINTNKSYLLNSNQLTKMVQTEKFKCENCEQRKKIIYKTSSVQCGGDPITFSVCTQVTEDDFYVKIPKTQSLASLTPAQLLAKSRGGIEVPGPPSVFNRSVDKDDFDILLNKSNYNNRFDYSRPADSYGMPQYTSPSSPSLRFNPPHLEEPRGLIPPFNPIIHGGGGRGRVVQPNLSRNVDSTNRFGYNNYF